MFKTFLIIFLQLLAGCKTTPDESNLHSDRLHISSAFLNSEKKLVDQYIRDAMTRPDPEVYRLSQKETEFFHLFRKIHTSCRLDWEVRLGTFVGRLPAGVQTRAYIVIYLRDSKQKDSDLASFEVFDNEFYIPKEKVHEIRVFNPPTRRYLDDLYSDLSRFFKSSKSLSPNCFSPYEENKQADKTTS